MYRWLRPLLFRLDAERAHRFAMRAARVAQKLPSSGRHETPRLKQTLFDLDFLNPVGIAAGLDKNAECIPFWEQIGCGFVEIGSVSAEPAPGNPKPRAFRLPLDRALINRMGLNNDGAAAIGNRIRRLRGDRDVRLGINIVKTNRPGLGGAAAIDDFCRSFVALGPLADYIALNISCPNTDDGKTFEEPQSLDALLEAIAAARTGSDLNVPILIKFSPADPEELDGGRFRELLAVSRSYGVDGYIATNTSVERDGLRTNSSALSAIGPGGLSGRPLAALSRRFLRFLYKETGGNRPIISVGGIDTVDEAVARIYMGASLIQLYTGLVYEGPGLVRRLVRGLEKRFELDGVPDMASAVGRLA
jgi:dihydroorotate dehydrogenase